MIKNFSAFLFITCCVFFVTQPCAAQYLRRADTIPVKENNAWLKNPWGGGLNYVQVSEIDINQDGIKDLFVFDRTGNKITTYINKGTPNVTDYVDSSFKYAKQFPHLENWVLMRDYNCDGKEDIFTYPINGGGVKVYKNISTPSSGLQFVLVTPVINGVPSVQSNYGSVTTNLFVSRVDIPTVEDIDCDGDLDVVTMNMSQTYFEFHINQSKELGYGCDSLIFKLSTSGCWGHFTENQNGGCSAYLNTCRTFNYDSLFATEAFRKNKIISDGEPRSNSTGETSKAKHAGNCSLCLDIDGDGDKDIFLGQLSCNNIILLTNSGNCANANMNSKDTAFPSYDIPIGIRGFPCGYFVDVNNDNKRDLIVCPNAENVSIDDNNIWYYQNIGTDNVPVFKRQKKNLFQEDMIEVGEGSDPSFFDFDNDGLSDLLVSNFFHAADSSSNTDTYNVQAFKNIGTASSPKFQLVNTDFANLSTQIPNVLGKHLTFGDLDGDGDMDMFVGDYQGQLHYFQNTAGAGNPANFVLSAPDPYLYNGTPLDVGNYATPQLIDLDRDGKLDLIIGEMKGKISYYKNIGTPTAPSFTLVTTGLGNVDVYKPCCSGYSVPFIYDSAGSYRMVIASEAIRDVGTEMGWIWYVKDIDGNLGGKFTVVDSMYQNIWEGKRMTITGKDINNDGQMDFVVGNYCGGVALYMGDSSAVKVHELNTMPVDFKIFPNPSAGILNISIPDLKSAERYDLSIFNLIGEKVGSYRIYQSESRIELNLGNGIYTCEMKNNTARTVKKLVVVK